MFSNSYLTYNPFILKKLPTSSTSGTEQMLFSSLTSKVIRYGLRYSPHFYSFLKNYKNITWLYVTLPNTSLNSTTINSTFFSPIISSYQTVFNLSPKTNNISV